MSKYLNLLIENIRHYAKNNSNAWVSQASGVSESTISQLMHGQRNPTLDVIVKLSDGFGVEPADLLANTHQRKIPSDILNLLENQSDTVYETIRTMLHALNQQQKKKAK